MCEMSQAVDVICVCDADGEVRPLRLRIPEADRSLLRVDIDEVVSVRQIQHVGVEASIYLCRATVHDRERLFELKFQFRTHSWKLLQSLY